VKWKGQNIQAEKQTCVATRLTASHELYSAGFSWPLTGIQKYHINRDEIWLDGQSWFLHWWMHTGSEFVLQDLLTQKPEGTSIARRTLRSTEGLKLVTKPDAGGRTVTDSSMILTELCTEGMTADRHALREFEIRTVEWQCVASIGWVVLQFKLRVLTACRYARVSDISDIYCDDARWLCQNRPGTAHSSGCWYQQLVCTSGHLTSRANDRIVIQGNPILQLNLKWHNFQINQPTRSSSLSDILLVV
jgi:hypothetical protein